MSRTTYDYGPIKQAYLASIEEPSFRELAERFGVKSFSVIADRARKENWAQLREAVKAKADEKVVTTLGDKRAALLAQIETDMLEVIQSAVLKMGIDLTDRFEQDPVSGERVFIAGTRVSPSDLAKLIDKFQVLRGAPTAINRSEEASLALTGDLNDLPPELLRGLLALARAKGASGEHLGQSPLPRSERARKVN